MFLAIKEILHSKFRYSLVIGLMFLIAYLVYFLTGLAYGLAMDNRIAVDQWEADYIVLAEEADSNLGMSMIPLELAEEVEAEEVAVLAQMPGVVTVSGESENDKITVSYFGLNNDQFIMPEIIEGDAFSDSTEAVVDISLNEEHGVEIGDTIKTAGNDAEFVITGFTENNKYNVSPVVFVSVPAYQQLRFELGEDAEITRVNGVVVRGDITHLPEELQQVSISEFINNLPGYSAQVLTFGFMIGFLIVIAAIVIGIFIYVLTMQKEAIFGVMKAQGISSGYISRSVVAQTFLLAVIGVSLGLAGTFLTSLVLPSTVPFQTNYWFVGAVSGLIIVFAVVGALFSVRAIVKIDPIEAIG